MKNSKEIVVDASTNAPLLGVGEIKEEGKSEAVATVPGCQGYSCNW